MHCIIIYYLLIVLSSLESVDSSTSVLGTKIKIIKNNNKNKNRNGIYCLPSVARGSSFITQSKSNAGSGLISIEGPERKSSSSTSRFSCLLLIKISRFL